VVLISPLLFGEASGEAWLAGCTVAMLVAGNGGIAVLVCSLIGVIVAILGWCRTHSHWAWGAVVLNILVPFAIPATFALDGYLETRRVEAESLPPIHYAAKRGDVDSIKKNLKKGVNVNDYHYYSGQTPLHVAAAAGQKEAAAYLLSRGAVINAKTNDGHTPLDLLLIEHENGDKLLPEQVSDMAAFLLEHGAQVGSTDFCMAAAANNITLMARFMQYDVDPNLALAEAVKNGSIEAVRFLIEKGVDVNYRRGSELIPLHLAAAAGKKQMVELLLNAGADPNPPMGSGVSPPLHDVIIRADEQASEEIVRLLVAAGADVNAPGSLQYTPLHHAVVRGSPALVRFLLESGAQVNAVDIDGRTPLHAAVGFPPAVGLPAGVARPGLPTPAAQKQIVRLLLENGADANLRTRRPPQRTPLNIVEAWEFLTEERAQHQREIIQLLKDYSKTGQVNQ
jgi:ankyrin repeat protein